MTTVRLLRSRGLTTLSRMAVVLVWRVRRLRVVAAVMRETLLWGLLRVLGPLWLVRLLRPVRVLLGWRRRPGRDQGIKSQADGTGGRPEE